MRVLSLTQGLRAPGGIETSLIKEIPPLRESGVEMIVLSASGGKMVSKLRDVGAEVLLPKRDLYDILCSNHEEWTAFVSDIIKSHQPDILYAHQMDVARSLKDIVNPPPLVAAIHSRFLHLMKEGEESALIEDIKGVSSFHAVGHAISEELRSLGVREITPIFSPVYPAPPKKQSQSRKKGANLLFVGRPDHRKGLDILLKAMDLLKEDIPSLKLTVLGDDGKTDPLLNGSGYESLAKRLGINEMISWLGHQDHKDVLEQMRSSDLLVSSSRQEGLVSIILESHSLALPVVATSVSAEAMNWGDAGIIVPRENPLLLAEAIKTDLRDPERLLRAQKNRDWVLENYSIPKLVNNIKSDFQRVVT
jgi:glycosyltransferase involved in cell wall biosynthesis